ncbi:uncharacterized protein F4807DRAFT_349737 [Annulohypoxylon truncatum]|uniref:uncharacterized protein n=1 Tax=Annulohypoxylon truncatum TaxID=327061 RepID=UPI00200724B5|nr:uncharacterized protein F4807DRAFT_349737 [Annulohypoxylon truncatum]KAI1212784.1 hypothetical protein F4807DRAFT_349737 [Annulohypoxylon truncatum]
MNIIMDCVVCAGKAKEDWLISQGNFHNQKQALPWRFYWGFTSDPQEGVIFADVGKTWRQEIRDPNCWFWMLCLPSVIRWVAVTIPAVLQAGEIFPRLAFLMDDAGHTSHAHKLVGTPKTHRFLRQVEIARRPKSLFTATFVLAPRCCRLWWVWWLFLVKRRREASRFEALNVEDGHSGATARPAAIGLAALVVVSWLSSFKMPSATSQSDGADCLAKGLHRWFLFSRDIPHG